MRNILGWCIISIYAAHYPKSVKKIVLVSTLGPDLSLVEAFQDNIRMRRYPNEEDSLKYWSEQPASKLVKLKQTIFFCMPYFYDHSIAKNALIKLLSMCEMNEIMEGLMLTDLAKHYDIKSQLKSYRGECIIVQPRQDVIPSADTSFQIKSILPQAKIFIIEKCGHFPDVERPNEFYKILRGVL